MARPFPTRSTSATWGSACPDPNTNSTPSCSRKHPELPSPCPPCWTTRYPLQPSINCSTNWWNPYSSMELSSGCPTSTLERWPKSDWPKHSLLQTLSYPQNRSGRTWPTHTTPYTPRLQYWGSELRWECTLHTSLPPSDWRNTWPTCWSAPIHSSKKLS